MLGVVKLGPDPTKLPPVAASYHSMVWPAGTVAVSVNVPAPHLENGPVPAVGGAGVAVMVAVIAVLVEETQVPVVLLVSA